MHTRPFKLTNPVNLTDWPTPRFHGFMVLASPSAEPQPIDDVVREAFEVVNNSIKDSRAASPVQRRGLFIALEGADGVGKSTMLDRLGREWLKHVEAPGVVLTREPTIGRFGQAARKLLGTINAESPRRLHNDIDLLFVADRLEHLEQEVYPALDRGLTVITDRYALSQLVYQTSILGLSIDEVRVIDGSVQVLHQACPMPDLTVWMDAPDDVLDERIKRRGGAEPVEVGEVARRVRRRYRELLLDPFNAWDGMSAPIIKRCSAQFVALNQHDGPENIYHAARLALVARSNGGLR